MKTGEKIMSKKLFTEPLYLTDGGLETTAIFHDGMELPHFASFPMLETTEGRAWLTDYYGRYLKVAVEHGLSYVVDSPTWRANRDWGYKLGYTEKELNRISSLGVRLAQEIRSAWSGQVEHILVAGEIGPRGDGYVESEKMTIDQARAYHRAQIEILAETGADVVKGLTMNYLEEAAGIVLAAREVGIAVIASFTVETDGCLCNGMPINQAMEELDRLTDSYATHLMINCAHPSHFMARVDEGGEWTRRIGGYRGNASALSHEELDNSTELDEGNRQELSRGYRLLAQKLPKLKVIGGCCGTDHTHLAAICKELAQA